MANEACFFDSINEYPCYFSYIVPSNDTDCDLFVVSHIACVVILCNVCIGYHPTMLFTRW